MGTVQEFDVRLESRWPRFLESRLLTMMVCLGNPKHKHNNPTNQLDAIHNFLSLRYSSSLMMPGLILKLSLECVEHGNKEPVHGYDHQDYSIGLVSNLFMQLREAKLQGSEHCWKSFIA